MIAALTSREEYALAIVALVIVLLIALGWLLHKGTTGRIEFGIFFRRGKNGQE